MNYITYNPIGIIHSPHKEPKGTPIQPTAAQNVSGIVEIFPEYLQGLTDLDGFSYAYLLYHFHLTKEAKLMVKPFMDDKLRGVFATRAPSRPNPIGLSIVRIEKIEGNKIFIKDVDIVDQTPLLDIKPYVSKFDHREVEKTGWLEQNVHKLPQAKDDGRFLK